MSSGLEIQKSQLVLVLLKVIKDKKLLNLSSIKKLSKEMVLKIGILILTTTPVIPIIVSKMEKENVTSS